MRQNHLLKILSICTLISSFGSASEIILPLASGEYSGKDPNLFTMLTTASQGAHYMLKGSVVFSDFQGESIQKHGGAFRNLKGPLRFSGTTPVANILLKNLQIGGLGSGIYSLDPILFENIKSFQAENNTSLGGVIAAQNIVFDRNHNLVFKNNISQNSGGAILLNKLETNSSNPLTLIVKNQRKSVVFSDNQARNSSFDFLNRGGAIACLAPDSFISFERNQDILFQRNTAYLGGAIYTSGSLIISETQNSLSFSENVSNQHGGAIFSQSFHLYDQSSPSFFIGNRSKMSGGAIYADKIDMSGNYGSIDFHNNQSGDCGGAIHAHTFHLYNQYSPITFINNCAKKNAGAIYADKIDISENYAPIFFKENQSGDCGGAFSTNSCRILAFHDVLFDGNIATGPYGGAIFLTGSRPTLHLEARSGDIIFQNNIVNSWHRPEGHGLIYPNQNLQPSFRTKIPNAITVENEPGEFVLSAHESYSIRFFDPIYSNKESSSPICINKQTEYGDATGTVIFSRTQPQSNLGVYSSVFNQPVHLYNGTLAIENGASLLVKEFKQFGGTLAVYPGTSVFVCSGETHFSNVSFGLSNYQTDRAYAQIDAPNIILSGSPTIYDPQGKFYYDHDTAAHPFHMDICFHARQKSEVNRSQFTIDNVVIESPSYGYQGSWKFQWLSPQSNILRAIWTPTGEYLLNPKHCGQLVPSSMWSTALAIRIANDTILDNFLNDSTLIPVNHACIFAGGLSGINKPDFSSDLICHHDIPTSLHTEHLGQFVGVKVPFSPDTIVSGTFVQMHGSCATRTLMEEEDTSKSNIVLGNVAAFKSWDALAFRASLNYAEETHDIQYAIQNKDMTKGCWKNQGWCGTIGLSYAYPQGIRYLKITPFADLEYVAIKQNPFLEIGSDPRYFSSSYLVNVAVPTGVLLELRLFGSSYSLLMKCGMAYVKDIKRENPSTSASLVLNEHQWKISSLPMGEEAIQFKCHTTLKYKAITSYIGFSTSQKEGNHMAAHASGGISVNF